MISRFTFFLIVFAICSTSFAQKFTTDDPGKYNDYIVGEQKLVMDKMVDYVIESVHGENEKKSAAMRDVVMKQLDMSIVKIQNLEPMKGDSKFREDALAILQQMKTDMTDDYNELNTLKKDMKSSFEAMEKVFAAEDKASEKMDKLNTKFKEAQNDFAKKNKMIIQKSTEEGDNIVKTINDVNGYSRKLFLQYFRVSKANGLYFDELNQKKPSTSKLESRRGDLVKASGTSLTELAKIEAYKNENFYKDKVINVVSEYQKFSSNEYAELVKLMESQEKKPKTNAEIDEYNKGVKRLNQIITKMNVMNQITVTEFNTAQSDFLKKYIPKKKKG